jgi:hypothetical protein
MTATERKIDFLKNLTLVEGHLTAGKDVYQSGDKEAAKTHMKHPGDELYAKLASGFKEFNAPRFDASLKRMALAVEQGKSTEDVNKAYETVVADIERARGKARPTLKERLLVASKVTRDAGNEFAEGVKDAKVMNAHEYQDAYGYLKAAARLVDTARPANAAQTDTVANVNQLLKKITDTWPDLSGKEVAKTNASEIYSTASQVELAASSLKP